MHRSNLSIQCGLWIAILLWFLPLACAQSLGVDDEAAVRQAGKDYLQALQKGDPKALADFWAADGTCTDASGKTVNMRDWLAKAANGGQNSKAAGGADAEPTAGYGLIKPRDVVVRFVAPSVAEEEGSIEAGCGRRRRRKRALCCDLDQARWPLETEQCPRNELCRGAGGRVRWPSLDIFAGQWSGTANQSTIKVSATWDATKKFMRRDFSMASGAASLAGTQEIGWDPVSRQIKSWTFFTDGSRGEGLWEDGGQRMDGRLDADFAGWENIDLDTGV